MPSFQKNVGSMMLGVGGAQLISLLAAPIITRLFVPEDFGVVALFMSIAAIIVIPTTLRLEQAIVLPKDDSDAYRVIAASIFALLGFCFVGTLLLLVAYLLGVQAIVEGGLGTAVFFLPVAVLLIGAGNIATGCAARLKVFKSVGRANFIQAVFIVSSRLITGLAAGSRSIVLVITLLFGSLLKLVILMRGIHYPLKSFFEADHCRNFGKVIYEYRQFPLYSVPTGLLRTFNDNLPVLVLAVLFTPQVVGLYAMASRLIKVPMMVVSEPIRLAYLQKASQRVQEGKSVVKSFLLLTLALFLVAILIILPLALFGKELFQLVLGQKWAAAGTYAALVSPWLASIVVQLPASCIYIVYRKQKRLMLLQGLATMIMVSTVLTMYALQLDVIATLIGISAVGTTLNFAVLVHAYFIARRI